MLEAIEEITVPTVSEVYEEDEGNSARGLVTGMLLSAAMWAAGVVAWLALR